MGCSASANVSNTLIPKQFQIVTESGKTFSMILDKLYKVSTIKHLMEMRIASKSDQLRLYIKIEQSESVQTPQSTAAATTVSSSSKIFKEFEGKSSIIQEGNTSYKLIELEDDKYIMQYAKLLANNPRIYLAQVKSQNTTNESVSTSVNSNRLRNQTIHIGCCFNNKPELQDDDAIIIAIQKLEKGEVLPQSQIDILQKGRSTLYKQSSQPQQTASPQIQQQTEESNQNQNVQKSPSSMPQITIEASS
ncbi:hypothetical protein TTHERM_00127040 (macronuclear) [Tetrahymena thermophila SB210]|uniref:Uncharacterized protein n=1 Tax=Tetrahymena thermophila (strain SB210) TaxID=312017 RepID=I7MJ76_TETTS|nr:hypothetical protein TTHERM_00127040 [Tetrahymena thermophila SB210]EAR96039.1 hypothetical protein TTHERM_00127040 [Tetrahymena thermophila SB210]|eukprot:XP_001016284.1 hypothetical protein TTHERM_00127040 [Tetrahymena thermophila SB210]